MLEKNKDYVEFTLQTMMATHRPYQDDTEVSMTGVINGYRGMPGCLDIPCDVVVIFKRYFDRLQTENEQLKKKLEEFSPVPGYEEFLRALYPDVTEETIEKLIWVTKHSFGGRDIRHNLQVDLEYYRALSSSQAKSIYNWKEATGCSTPEEAKEFIDGKKKRIIKLNDELDNSLSANEELKKKLGEFDFMGWMESAKLWKKKYDDIFKLIGFSSDEELHDYLANDAECDTLREAIASLEHNVKFARDERRDLSKKLDECEKDYISERDKVTALQTENEQLKKKLQVPDPFAEYKELFEKLHSKEDIEKFEWTLNHICGGQASANGWMVTAKLWRRNYETLSKLVGFSSTEEIQDYLTNEAECDTLQEAVSKLKDQVKYTCDEWYSADSIYQWQKVTGYDNPKDFLKWKANIEGIVEAWKSETGCKYPGEARVLLEKWKTLTKCETPEAAATWITSYEKACERGNELAEKIEEWKKATGCDTPGEVEEKIKHYKSRLGNAVQAASCAAKHLDIITF